MRTIRSHIRPVQALEMPPVVINIVKQFTGEEPMSGIVADAEAVIQQPGMLSASVAEGYPYADVAEMGMAFLAISDSDAIAAREAARWRARRAWDKRAQFIATTPSADAALEAVMAAPRGSDGTFEEPTPIHGGFRFFDGGPTVVLETIDDHTLVLTTRLIGNTSIQQMYSVGVAAREQAHRGRQGGRLAATGVCADRHPGGAGQYARRDGVTGRSCTGAASTAIRRAWPQVWPRSRN